MNIILFEALPAGNVLRNDDYRFAHITDVLRLKEGDTFFMGICNGASGTATITKLTSQELSFNWQGEISPQSLHPVTLLVAQVRPICMKRILRESTSLGVEALFVSGTDTGEKSYQEAKLWGEEEYKRYLLNGAMQAGGTGIPSVTLFNYLGKIESELSHYSERLVLDNVGENTPSLSTYHYRGEKVLLAIGPERGWSERERTWFAEHNFTTFTLGKRILRTETACSGALTLLLSRMGLL